MTLTETANDCTRIARNLELFDTVAATQHLMKSRKLEGASTSGSFALHLACVAMWRALAKGGK